MGQKVNPIGLRLGVNRSWDSVWFDEKNFAARVNEDILIRHYLNRRFARSSISTIQIDRKPSKTTPPMGRSPHSAVLKGLLLLGCFGLFLLLLGCFGTSFGCFG